MQVSLFIFENSSTTKKNFIIFVFVVDFGGVGSVREILGYF